MGDKLEVGCGVLGVRSFLLNFLRKGSENYHSENIRKLNFLKGGFI